MFSELGDSEEVKKRNEHKKASRAPQRTRHDISPCAYIQHAPLMLR